MEQAWIRTEAGPSGARNLGETGIVTQLQPLNSKMARSAVDSTLATGDLGTFALALEHASAFETLTWATERYDEGLTFATGFGPEGCVLIDLIGRHRLPIDIFTLDTGLLFPETRALWKQLEDRYELTIRGTQPAQSVDEQALAHGDKLWESAPNRCCELRKVIPLRAELSSADAWITAIRRDQTPERSNARVVEWDEKFEMPKSIRWCDGPSRTCGRISTPTMCPTMHFTTKGTPASGVCRARHRSRRARMTGRVAGAVSPRPNAVCTVRCSPLPS